MKDLTGLTHSFHGWGAVLDFLANIKPAKDLNNIEIAREGDKEWLMNINKAHRKASRKSSLPLVGLYDLYW